VDHAPSSESFRTLLAEVEAGSQEAIQQLLDLQGGAVLRVVRARLNRLLRREYDSQDFLQAVWASFFKNRDLCDRFDSVDQLAAFLKTVAANKVKQECRRKLSTQKRDRRRERGAESWGVASLDALSHHDPTPSAVVAARDQLDRFSPAEQQLLELRAAGSTHEEIAATMRLHPSTVRRILKRIQATTCTE